MYVTFVTSNLQMKMPNYIDILKNFPIDIRLRKDAENYKQLIKDVFESFDVKFSHIDIIFGPVITLYESRPISLAIV